MDSKDIKIIFISIMVVPVVWGALNTINLKTQRNVNLGPLFDSFNGTGKGLLGVIHLGGGLLVRSERRYPNKSRR